MQCPEDAHMKTLKSFWKSRCNSYQNAIGLYYLKENRKHFTFSNKMILKSNKLLAVPVFSYYSFDIFNF